MRTILRPSVQAFPVRESFHSSTCAVEMTPVQLNPSKLAGPYWFRGSWNISGVVARGSSNLSKSASERWEVGHRYGGFSCRSTRTQTETVDDPSIHSLASQASCSYQSENPISNKNLTSRAPEWLRNLTARSAIFFGPSIGTMKFIVIFSSHKKNVLSTTSWHRRTRVRKPLGKYSDNPFINWTCHALNNHVWGWRIINETRISDNHE